MSAKLCLVEFLLSSCVLLKSSECGPSKGFQLNYDFSRETLGQGLISGGVETERIETPWKIAIFEEKVKNVTKFMKYICGGSLISDELIVTAAHCLHEKDHEFPKDPSKLQVVLGAQNLSNETEFGRKTDSIKEIIIHDGWSSEAISFNHDIALIRLDRKVKFTRFIQPIAINLTLGLEEFGKVVAWGEIDDDGTIADVARIAELKTIEIAKCLQNYRKLALIFWTEAFCAVNVDQGVCPGDSGSGFYIEFGGKKYLKGLVSSGIVKKCSENEVALFTDITKYYNFIQENFNYASNILKFKCDKWSRSYYSCYANYDGFNFDRRVTEIQLYDDENGATIDSGKEIKFIDFSNKMLNFLKFQKQLFKSHFPNLNEIHLDLKNDIELTKKLSSFLKKFGWIGKLVIFQCSIDKGSLNMFEEVDQLEKLSLQ